MQALSLSSSRGGHAVHVGNRHAQVPAPSFWIRAIRPGHPTARCVQCHCVSIDDGFSSDDGDDVCPTDAMSTSHNQFHPELMEGPLQYLPSGWARQLSDSQDHMGSTSPVDQEDIFSSLRQNPYWSQSGQASLDMVAEGPSILQRFPKVYGILFGLDGQGQEGFYSLRACSPDGMPRETIVVFEGRDDAERYAGLLEATMDPHVPHVCHVPSAQLVAFCMEHGYRCQLELLGSLLMPPECNVGVTNWERARRLRNGNFAVLESEPNTDKSSHTSC